MRFTAKEHGTKFALVPLKHFWTFIMFYYVIGVYITVLQSSLSGPLWLEYLSFSSSLPQSLSCLLHLPLHNELSAVLQGCRKLVIQRKIQKTRERLW